MDRLRKFMYGRYGIDQFSQTLIISALAISIVGTMFHSSLLIYLCYIPMAYAFYRILSKKVNKRMQENYKFVGILNIIKDKFQKKRLTISGSKTHKFYHCPECRQTIRVPKGKGKICITCPKCRREFIKRT